MKWEYYAQFGKGEGLVMDAYSFQVKMKLKRPRREIRFFTADCAKPTKRFKIYGSKKNFVGTLLREDLVENVL